MPNPDLEKVDKVAELRGTTRSVILRTIINGVLQGKDKKPRNEAA
jgi:metal-responsive CopG/Arc/MetJ family transcriptional regulator